MKRWAVFTVLLYALALLLLTVPAILIAFANWGKNHYDSGFSAVFGIYLQWGYWLWLAVLVTGQVLLLLVPIDISERRLTTRRKLKVPVIVSAFFLANLCFAGIFSILCAIFTDKAFNLFDLPFIFIPNAHPDADHSSWSTFVTMLGLVLIFWLMWAVIFNHATKSDDPDSMLKRIVRWLLRGSILELIIAVPSHVIVRRRDDCCAPAGTFWGIATGISVMLLCFGPGVYFLFVERMKRLQPKATSANKLL